MRCLTCFIFVLCALRCSASDKYNYYTGKIGDREVEMSLYSSDTSNGVTGFYHFIGENKIGYIRGEQNMGVVWLIESHYDFSLHGYDTISEFRGDFVAGENISGDWQYRKDTMFHLPFRLVHNAKGSSGVDLVNHAISDKKFYRDSVGDTIYSLRCDLKYFTVLNGNSEAINHSMFPHIAPVESTIYPQYDSLAADWIYEYAVFTNANINDGTLNSWGCDFTGYVNINWNGSGVICFDVGYDSYDGGAHGNAGGQSYSYNLKTGKEITLDDIFLPGYDSVLTHLTDSLLSDESDFRDTVKYNNDFTLTPEGIGFNYDTYEISSYVAGSFYAFIPWSRLNPWIDPKGPMNWVRK